MMNLAKVMAILAFTGAVTANPVPEAGASFSLESDQVSEHAVHDLEKMVTLKRSLGIEVHPKLAEAAKRATLEKKSRLAARKVTGIAHSTNAASLAGYIYPIQVGGKTIRVAINVAAGGLWCFSNAQPKDQLVGHQYYDVNPAKKNVTDMSLFYDPEEIDGDQYRDSVTVGGVTVTNTFLAASNITSSNGPSGSVADKHVDGLLGLGVHKYNSIGEFNGKGFDFKDFTAYNTWFEDAIPVLEKPVFAIAHTIGRGGYDFGFIDHKKIAGSIAWVNNVLEDYWPAYSFFGEGVAIGDSNAKITPRKQHIDLNSETYISFTDTDVVNEWYSKIPGAVTENFQAFTIPCQSNPPGWTVVIAGKKFFTPGWQLIGEPVDKEGKTCLGGLQLIGGGVDFSLFGVNFMVGKYIIIDQTNNNQIKLGFAMRPEYH